MAITPPLSNSTVREIRLGLIGFMPTENLMIKGGCKLLTATQHKPAHATYTLSIVDTNSPQDIHIYLVNTSVHPAVQSRRQIKARHPQAVIIFVGIAEPPTGHADEYVLERKEFGRPLMNLLKEVIDQLPDERQAAPAKTCLIVDDSQLVRTQMEMLMQGLQVATEFAEDAETALQMVRNKPYDIIFLDVILPEMDGYKACKLIKADPATKKTPVVMLTSKRSPFNKMHGALVGCDRYLTKPIDADKVHKVLQQYAILAKA